MSIKKRLAVFGKLIYPENRSRFSYDTACCIFSVLNSSEGKPLFTRTAGSYFAYSARRISISFAYPGSSFGVSRMHGRPCSLGWRMTFAMADRPMVPSPIFA